MERPQYESGSRIAWLAASPPLDSNFPNTALHADQGMRSMGLSGPRSLIHESLFHGQTARLVIYTRI